MQRWTQILPFFVVAWLARRHCERMPVPGLPWLVVMPYRGVLIDASLDPLPRAPAAGIEGREDAGE